MGEIPLSTNIEKEALYDLFTEAANAIISVASSSSRLIWKVLRHLNEGST